MTTTTRLFWLTHNNETFTLRMEPTQFVTEMVSAAKQELLLAVPVTRIAIHEPQDGPPLEKTSLIPEANTPDSKYTVVILPAVASSVSPPSTSRSSSNDSIFSKRQKRFERWDKINNVIAASKKKKRVDGSSCYSNSNWNQLGPIFSDDIKPYEQVTQDIGESDLAVLSTVLSWIYKSYGGTVYRGEDNEEKRIHLIAPIIWAVVQQLSDVKVGIESNLDGKRVDAHGHFEFVLTRGKKRICIVEAKKEDFEQGLAQNLLGCEVAADLDNSEEVDGVATNFGNWIFLRSMDTEILCDEQNPLSYSDDGKPDEAQLKKITGKLCAMLQTPK